MKRITVENHEYEVIEDNGDCFDKEEFTEKYTDYFAGICNSGTYYDVNLYHRGICPFW